MRKKNYYELNNIDLDKVYYFVPKGRGNSKKGESIMDLLDTVRSDNELYNKLFNELWETQNKIDELSAFINNDKKFFKQDIEMQELVKKQLEVIKEYHFYLSLRMRLVWQKVLIGMKNDKVYELKGTLNALYGTLGKEQYDKLMENVKAEDKTET